MSRVFCISTSALLFDGAQKQFIWLLRAPGRLAPHFQQGDSPNAPCRRRKLSCALGRMFFCACARRVSVFCYVGAGICRSIRTRGLPAQRLNVSAVEFQLGTDLQLLSHDENEGFSYTPNFHIEAHDRLLGGDIRLHTKTNEASTRSRSCPPAGGGRRMPPPPTDFVHQEVRGVGTDCWSQRHLQLQQQHPFRRLHRRVVTGRDVQRQEQRLLHQPRL